MGRGGYLLLATAFCTVLVAGFVPAGPRPPLHHHHPPLHPPPPPPPPPKPTPGKRPQKQFPGSVCPADTTCVRPQDCSRQCRPGWDSFDLTSCYLVAPNLPVLHGTAVKDCEALDAHLPVLEDAAELAELADFGPFWTDATWDADSATWIWASTGEPVDFAALGVLPAADGTPLISCLLAQPGPVLQPADCTAAAVYICETGSSSVARCARQKDRLCCAVTYGHYGEPCYVDELGTRCEQRIREGYFPLGESLVLPTEGTVGGRRSWEEARAICLKDGGDLLVVDDAETNQQIVDMLKGLEVLGGTEYYIGLSSDAAGTFNYVNGTTAIAGESYLNFASAADASQPDACAYYFQGAWRSGDCALARDYICHIRRVRHSLVQEPEEPRCGRRQTQGVLGKSAGLFPLPPPPPVLPPLGVNDDGRRGAAQFGEFPWQAAVWTRSDQADHQFSCSGALVHTSWVLTSADCVFDTDPEDLKVTLGDWNLDETQPVNLPPVALDVTHVQISPGRVSHGPYSPVREPGRLAMLRITPDVGGNEYPHVSPICLPDASFVQHINQLRCVVTGWRGGTKPLSYFWRPEVKPDLRDILRKFETGARHDPECQDLAQHLKQLKQRPPFAPFLAFPPYSPHPVPFSAAGRDVPEGRSFGPLPFFGPPPPPTDQPELYVCPRDLRCIPDRGALLACALPPPPPPPPPRPLPPHHHPRPLPPPYLRSAQNDTTSESPAAAAPPAAASAAAAAAAPADAYEQLSQNFRPPLVSAEKAESPRARRSADAAAAVSPAAAAASAAPAPAAAAAGAKQEARDASGRAAIFMPHDLLGAFAPHHHHDLHHDPQLPVEPEPPLGSQPVPASTPLYDAYVLVGIASALTPECSHGQMIFDDVIQEAEFVQQVLHRDA